jgi:NAD(P)-dependent dehydrogenase (short-subunit alcohol dehydrogenase family)
LQLAGTTQVITGAGSGLGKGSAELFAEEGANVICADLDLGRAEATARGIEANGGSAFPVRVDVANWDSVQEMAAASIARYGQIHGVFANAGLPGAGAITNVDLSNWQRTIDVNLTGAMYTAKAFIENLAQTDGASILFTASISGLKGFPSQVAYAASKGGVIAMARQIATDLAPQKIRVNALCPGLVVTPLVEDLYQQRAELNGGTKEEALQAMAARYPLGRTGTPQDMANMALFLQSAKADWITGQSFSVDGGMTA